MIVINIIPSNYNGNPRNALGYAWADWSLKTPGHDVVAEHTENGTDWRSAAKGKMAELGVTEAYVNCMWCGGFDGMFEATVEPESKEEPAPLTVEEIATNEYASEEAALSELDRENKNKIGWCDKCHSYCFGDCEANQGD